MLAKPLARPCVEGIELLPRPPGNRERDNSETRVHTVQSQLAGDAPRRQGDEAAGAGVEEMSTGSVTSTGQMKGPWNSYFRGPFAYFLGSIGL